MLGCLAIVSPLDIASGARVPVYLSSFGRRADAAANGLGGHRWEPAIVQRPTVTQQLWNGDFTAALDPGRAALPVNLAVLARSYPALGTYVWIGAPVDIYVLAADDALPATPRFSGRITDYAGTYPHLTLQAECDLEPLKANVLTASYTGTGGAEGGADLKNRLKPLILGVARSVEPVLLDAVNSVYQFSGYGAIEAVDALFERGSDFGAADGDHASYAALVAAAIVPGHWATCLAEGLVRLGAPAYGVITGDVHGHALAGATPRLTGAIVSALAGLAGVDAGLIESATLAALDTRYAYPANLVVTEQTPFLDLAGRLALAANAIPLATLTGTLALNAVDLTAEPVLTLDAQGRALPQVASAEEQRVSPPYQRTTLGAARCWRVHSADEIAFSDALTGYLTNEATSVAAASDGSVASFADAGGTFLVEQDGSPVLTGVVFSVASETGVDLTIDAATGDYTVEGMSADTGSAVLEATLGDKSVTKVYTIAKAVAGTQSVAFALKPNTAALRYDTNGTIFTGQALTFSLERQNSTASFVVRLYRINANGSTTQLDAGSWLTGSGTVTADTPDALSFTQTGAALTLSGTNFASAVGANQGLLVEVTCDALVDAARVIKVQDGAAGYSYAELAAYRRATSQPATPTGGSYNFTSKALTAPSGWSDAVSAGSDPVWLCRTTAAVQGASGASALGAWSTPVKAFENGADGQAVDIVYRRAATQPTTPSPSSGVPTSWYGDPGSVPAGSGVLWSSVGERSTPAANFVWQAAVQIEGRDGTDGADGTDGTDGTDGEDGSDGLSSAAVLLYRRTTTSSAPALGTSGSATYTFATGGISGQPSGWTTAIPSESEGQFLWVTRVHVAGTATTATIANSAWPAPVLFAQNGTNTAVVTIYRRSATALDDTDRPSAATTWTFATAALAGLTNGWTTGVPAGTSPLYACAATANSASPTDTIAASEWSTPVLLVQDGSDGADGLNTATVLLYRRTTTSTAPNLTTTGSTTYTFATGGTTGAPAGWSRGVPESSDGGYLWQVQATAVSTGATDAIANTEWSEPALIAQDGAAGLSVAEFTIYKRAASAPAAPSGGAFAFATQTLTPPSGWSSSVPAIDGNPLYVAIGTAAVVGTADTATPSWGAPVLALKDAEAVNAVFVRTLAPSGPTTPSPSPAVPILWSDTPPAGSNPLWVSYGARASPANDWTWSTPVRVEGTSFFKYIQDTVPFATAVGETWYKITAREQYIARAAGANEIATGEWERMLGDLAAIDSIASDNIDIGAINLASYVKQTGTFIVGIEQTGAGVVSNMPIEGDTVVVTLIFPYTLTKSGPTQGVIYYFDIEIYYQIGPLGTRVYSDVYRFGDSWDQPSAASNITFPNKTAMAQHVFAGLSPASNYNWGYRITTNGAGNTGNGVTLQPPRFMSVDDKRAAT
jgi:hypothetical protein